MNYYQAVYQMDIHGYNLVYSKNIWKSEEEAHTFLSELRKYLGGAIHANWVNELFLDET